MGAQLPNYIKVVPFLLKWNSCVQIGEMLMYFKMADISGKSNSYNVSKSDSLGNLIQIILIVNHVVHTIHLKERA